MPPTLVERLESLSGYRAAFDSDGPEAAMNGPHFSHVALRLGSGYYHVLSRIAPCGVDYSGRPNKIAHHLVLPPGSTPEAGPAALAQADGVFRARWEGDPTLIDSSPRMPQPDVAPAPCAAWAAMTGDAGWAGEVLRRIRGAARPCVVVLCPAQADRLALVGEILNLLPAGERWLLNYSTGPGGEGAADVHWPLRIWPLSAETLRIARSIAGADIINAGQPLAAPADEEHVLAARTGQRLQPRVAASGPRIVAAPPKESAEPVPSEGAIPLMEGQQEPASTRYQLADDGGAEGHRVRRRRPAKVAQERTDLPPVVWLATVAILVVVIAVLLLRGGKESASPVQTGTAQGSKDAEAQRQADEQRAKIGQLEADKVDLQKQLSIATDNKAKLENEKSALEGTISSHQATIDRLQRTIDDQRAQIEQLAKADKTEGPKPQLIRTLSKRELASERQSSSGVIWIPEVGTPVGANTQFRNSGPLECVWKPRDVAMEVRLQGSALQFVHIALNPVNREKQTQSVVAELQIELSNGALSWAEFRWKGDVDPKIRSLVYSCEIDLVDTMGDRIALQVGGWNLVADVEVDRATKALRGVMPCDGLDAVLQSNLSRNGVLEHKFAATQSEPAFALSLSRTGEAGSGLCNFQISAVRSTGIPPLSQLDDGIRFMDELARRLGTAYTEFGKKKLSQDAGSRKEPGGIPIPKHNALIDEFREQLLDMKRQVEQQRQVIDSAASLERSRELLLERLKQDLTISGTSNGARIDLVVRLTPP